MEMQNQNTNQLIPKVRYHPTIQTQTSGHGARAKTRTSQTQRTRPAAVGPPQTGTDNKVVQEAPQVNPVPAVRPRLDGGQKQKQSAQKPVNKPVQRAATDPDPPQTPDQLPNRAAPRPDQVPLGLGVQMDRRVVEEVEALTRGQRTNQNWFTWRKNRITASVAHSIARCRFVHGKSKTPPTSYLAAITGRSRPHLPVG